MATGSVARFDPKRGYGFLIPDDGGEDVFVHQNNIDMEGFRYLKPGERVSYELEVGEKGMKAVQVGLLEPRREDDRPQRGGPRGGGGGYQRDGYRSGGGGGRRPGGPGGPGGDRLRDQVDALRKKQERLVSLLVEKGVLEPGEIDNLENAVKSAATAEQVEGDGDG